MSNEIVKAQANIIVTMDDAERAAKAMAGSGYFKDAAQAAQAIVKILAGQEMGFGPFTSMNGIHIIQGRPSVSANLMAAAVKRSGRYNYRVTEMTDKRCAIAFFEAGQQIGDSVFTDDDAKKAGTQNMGKFPRNMLFARAMSNGVRWYCPDVFSGSAVYTPEELGAVVDGDGNVVSTPEIEVIKPQPVEMTPDEAAAMTTKKGTRYGDLTRDQLETIWAARSASSGEKQAAKVLLAELDRLHDEITDLEAGGMTEETDNADPEL